MDSDRKEFSSQGRQKKDQGRETERQLNLVSIAGGLFSLLCHLVDDRGKVGGAVELHFTKTVIVRLQHAFDADAVCILTVGVLRGQNTHALERTSTSSYIIHEDVCSV